MFEASQANIYVFYFYYYYHYSLDFKKICKIRMLSLKSGEKKNHF